mmetsp:Transcript_52094/g.122317  ORF Transcript_52094/g.122317 Transcript_52094/m.122317 type:complete len:256 (+) Transcript_52094:1023-1790(+)
MRARGEPRAGVLSEIQAVPEAPQRARPRLAPPQTPAVAGAGVQVLLLLPSRHPAPRCAKQGAAALQGRWLPDRVARFAPQESSGWSACLLGLATATHRHPRSSSAESAPHRLGVVVRRRAPPPFLGPGPPPGAGTPSLQPCRGETALSKRWPVPASRADCRCGTGEPGVASSCRRPPPSWPSPQRLPSETPRSLPFPAWPPRPHLVRVRAGRSGTRRRRVASAGRRLPLAQLVLDHPPELASCAHSPGHTSAATR